MENDKPDNQNAWNNVTSIDLETNHEIITPEQIEIARNIEEQLAGHPLYEILRDPSSLASIGPEEMAILRQVALEKRKSDKLFRDGLADILSDDSIKHIIESSDQELTVKEARISLLRIFYQNTQIEKTFLSAQEMATLLYEFKALGSHQDVIRLYEESDSLIFKESQTVKEFIAVAYKKTGELEKSEAVIRELLATDSAKIGECAGVLGGVYLAKAENAENPEERIQLLTESVKILEEGYGETFEFYPGMNLVYNKIQLGIETGNIDLVNEAIGQASLVEISVKKAGGLKAADYWTVVTSLESAIVAGDEVDDYIQGIVEMAKRMPQGDWEESRPVEKLSQLKERLTLILDSDIDAAELKLKISKIIVNANKAIDAFTTKISHDTTDDIQKTSDQIFLEMGFMYGETTTFIGGNTEFGGRLHSHVVNRSDIAVANSIIDVMSLDKVENWDQANDIIDTLIRTRFGTASLEDLHGASHKSFEIQTENTLDIMGIDKNDVTVDTRTNVMVDFFLGKGDCRPHGHTKQALFDCWKTKKINGMMADLYNANKTGITEIQQDEIKTKIDLLLKTQMFVFDSVIEAQIEMEEPYSPKMKNGGTIASDEYQMVEEHTWNGLITVDDTGHIIEARMVDSFYQNEYQFGSPNERITFDPVAYIEGRMSGDTIESFDVDGNSKRVPVKLSPAVYSGDREKRVKRADDIGGAKFRGIDIAPLPTDSEGRVDVTSLFDPDTMEIINKFWDNIERTSLVAAH